MRALDPLVSDLSLCASIHESQLALNLFCSPYPSVFPDVAGRNGVQIL